MNSESVHIPRAMYGLCMALATACALVLVWVAARGLGGDERTVTTAVVVFAGASMATFAPAVLNIGLNTWGVAVLVSGMVRSLAALGAAWVMTENNPLLASRPMLLGIGAGVGVVLVAETVTAIVVISKTDRRRRHAA